MTVEDHKTTVTSGLQSEHCVVHLFTKMNIALWGSPCNSSLLHHFTMCTHYVHRKCIGVEQCTVAGNVVSLSDLASASAKCKCKSKSKSISKSKCMQQLYAHCIHGKCVGVKQWLATLSLSLI